MRNKSKQAAVLTLLSHARPMRPATCANEARLYRNPTNPDWCWTALSGSSRHAQTSADDAVFLDPVHSDTDLRRDLFCCAPPATCPKTSILRRKVIGWIS